MSNDFKAFLVSKNGELLMAGLAELLGTILLVVIACGAGSVGSSGVLGVALTFGLTVMALAASIGHISGCHVNPAVTIGLLVNGRTDPIRAAVYIVAQMVGGVAGAAALAGILPTGTSNLCVTRLNDIIDVNPIQGIFVELIITFLLVSVVCSACDSNLAPILIGMAVTAGHIFAIPLTGSSMNTARSFGPALIEGHWSDHYVYWLGPLIGGALAGLLQRFLSMSKTETGGKGGTKSDKTLKTDEGSIL